MLLKVLYAFTYRKSKEDEESLEDKSNRESVYDKLTCLNKCSLIFPCTVSSSIRKSRYNSKKKTGFCMNDIIKSNLVHMLNNLLDCDLTFLSRCITSIQNILLTRIFF